MDYRAAVAWLDARADLERTMSLTGWRGVKLERMVQLCDLLGRPETWGRTIHIAGSKGKGSVAAMVASVLRADGNRVGLYTSPDLTSRRERMTINGRPIGQGDLARIVRDRLVPAVAAYIRRVSRDDLSYYDLLTALAFLWFAEHEVDWTVLEVGLGGRLDATNVCRPEVCAITTLGLEHTQFLGETLAEIAAEKAGIIKRGRPVVAAPQPPEAMEVLRAAAAAQGAELIEANGVRAVPGAAFIEGEDGAVGQRVAVELGDGEVELLLPLLGPHQITNAAVARTVLAVLGTVRAEALVHGLQATEWPGRLQIVGRRPWVVLDGAHTPDAGARLAESLAQIPHQRAVLVLGSARDKNVAGLLTALVGSAETVIATSVPGNQRALPAAALAELARPLFATVETCADPLAAVARATALCGPDDLVCVTGSLYLVGAVLAGPQGREP